LNIKKSDKGEVYWSPYTGLATKILNWKHRQVDLYIAEFIVFMRMRGYMLDDDNSAINTVMFDDKPVEVVV